MATEAFNVGRFSATTSDTSSPWREVGPDDDHLAVIDSVPNGTRLKRFGFYAIVSAAHKRRCDLDPLRQVGDVFADHAYDAWLSHRRSAACPGSRDILAELESDALAVTSPVSHFLKAAAIVPEWLDVETLRRATLVHWKHSLGIGTALLNLSLVGGFGSPRINAVLGCTGYLAAGSRDTVYRRLIETLAMIVDCFDGGPDAMLPGGKGWRSALNVRLLHAAVRHRLLEAGPDVYDASTLGVPINQEDLVVTQLAFSVVVLMGLERTGLAFTMSDSDMCDYLHAWRWIGHLMGIKPENNLHMGSLRDAQTMLESLAWHLVDPDEGSARMAMRVIDAVAYRPPLPWTHSQHVAVTRAMTGDAYADALGIPRLGDPELERMNREGAQAYRTTVERAQRTGSQQSPTLMAATTAVRRAVISVVASAGRAIVFGHRLVYKALSMFGFFDSPGTANNDAAPMHKDAAFAARALGYLGAAQRLATWPFIGPWIVNSARKGMRQLVTGQLPGGAATFYPRWLQTGVSAPA